MLKMCASRIQREPSEHRKIRKPLMEKKRRARINECLEELKKILLKDRKECLPNERPSKLEKADILEKTLDLVRRLIQNDSNSGAYIRGVSDCENRVQSLVESYENLDVRQRKALVSFLFPSVQSQPLLALVHSTHKQRQESVETIWRPW